MTNGVRNLVGRAVKEGVVSHVEIQVLQSIPLALQPTLMAAKKLNGDKTNQGPSRSILIKWRLVSVHWYMELAKLFFTVEAHPVP